jgi:hypothetical protein
MIWKLAMPLQWLLSNIDFYLSCEEGGEALLPPSSSSASGFSSSFWSFVFGFHCIFGVDLRWVGLLRCTRAPPVASLACSGHHCCCRFCGWLLCRCAWLFWFLCTLGCRSIVFGSSSCTCLIGGLPSCSGSSPPLAQPRVAAMSRSGTHGRWCF